MCHPCLLRRASYSTRWRKALKYNLTHSTHGTFFFVLYSRVALKSNSTSLVHFFLHVLALVVLQMFTVPKFRGEKCPYAWLAHYHHYHLLGWGLCYSILASPRAWRTFLRCCHLHVKLFWGQFFAIRGPPGQQGNLVIEIETLHTPLCTCLEWITTSK